MHTSTRLLRISTDPSELDIPLIHAYLNGESYWARGIPLPTLRRAIDASLCFGGFIGSDQVAFARVISDFATFAYLSDVFVVAAHRGHGYSKQMLEAVVGHPSLQGLRRFALATSDAHGLYAQFGFKPLARPQTFMERQDPDIYG